jgi:hypothetical protein
VVKPCSPLRHQSSPLAGRDVHPRIVRSR